MALLSIATISCAQAGQIAQELVVKWCYLNQQAGNAGTITGTCFTLNDDGTYEYVIDDSGLTKASAFFSGPIGNRDFGTWRAEGNTIFYVSDANGEGSFKFQKVNQPQNEGNPMIVVGGVSFASAIPKDPW